MVGQLLEMGHVALGVAGRERHLHEALVALGEHRGEHRGRSRRASRRWASACRRSRAAPRAGPVGRGAAPTSRSRRRPSPRGAGGASSACCSSVGSSPALAASSPITQIEQRADRHVRQHVHGLRRAARARRGTPGTSPSPTACPAASTPSGSPRPASSMSMACSRSAGRTGAKPKPQLPITTDVTPCQPDSVQYGSQNTCAS